MSRASSFAAMAQQLGISLGVGFAAVTLNLSMLARGAEHLGLPDLVLGFAAIGVLTALSILSFRRLAPEAGNHLHQNKKLTARRWPRRQRTA